MRKFRFQCAIIYSFSLFLLILIPIYYNYFYSSRIIPANYAVYLNEKMYKILNGQRRNGGKNLGIK
jgi:hypothetical protein